MFRDAGVAEWQTHLTQNQAGNNRVGSSPTSGTTLGGKTFVLPPIFYIIEFIYLIYIFLFEVTLWIKV